MNDKSRMVCMVFLCRVFNASIPEPTLLMLGGWGMLLSNEIVTVPAGGAQRGAVMWICTIGKTVSDKGGSS